MDTEVVETMPEHDRPVQVREVAKEAKPRRCLCRGTGVINVVKSARGAGPVRKDQTIVHEQLCGCALPRFLKKYEGQVIFYKENLYWAVGKAPELPEDVSTAVKAEGP